MTYGLYGRYKTRKDKPVLVKIGKDKGELQKLKNVLEMRRKFGELSIETVSNKG